MTFPPDIIEKVARAICHAGFCIRGKFERRPCVDDDGRTVECQATHNQLIPSLPWRCAQAALEELPPSAAVKEEREACAKALEEALELLAELGPMISKMRTIAGDASAITGDIEATLVTIGYGGSALATEKEIK